MAKKISSQMKRKFINKLNKAFNWDIDMDKIEIIVDRTSGAYKWASLGLTPELHSEFSTASDIIKAKDLSFDIGGYNQDGIEIIDEPFQKGTFTTLSDKNDTVNFSYQVL